MFNNSSDNLTLVAKTATAEHLLFFQFSSLQRSKTLKKLKVDILFIASVNYFQILFGDYFNADSLDLKLLNVVKFTQLKNQEQNGRFSRHVFIFVSYWEIIYVRGSFIQTFGPTLALLFEGFINCFSIHWTLYEITKCFI